MDRDQLDKSLLVAVGILVLGAIGPWATAFGVSKAGTSGDGVITLAGALLALGLIRLAGRPTPALVIAVLIDAVVIYDFVDVSGTELVSVGWGLYLSLIGGALLTYVTFQLRRPAVTDSAAPASGPGAGEGSGPDSPQGPAAG